MKPMAKMYCFSFYVFFSRYKIPGLQGCTEKNFQEDMMFSNFFEYMSGLINGKGNAYYSISQYTV